MEKSIKEQRQERIVEILSLLHKGGSFEEAKKLFNEEFDGVDVTEITAAERALIQGGLDPSEIQKLCNIHAAVFKGSINDIHQSNEGYGQPGHPVHTLKLENQVLQSLMSDEIDGLLTKIEAGDWSFKERLIAALKDLNQLNKHYARKETLIFSYMEKYGITAPPMVMWGVDDSIRDQIKEINKLVLDEKTAFNPLKIKWENLKNEIDEMIFKEEEIMIPMTLDIFSLNDWDQIAKDSFDIGFAYIPDPLPWRPSNESLISELEREPARLEAINEAKEMTEGIAAGLKVNPDEEELKTISSNIISENHNLSERESIEFPTGTLQMSQLIQMFRSIPVDLTFVDDEDTVCFYSEGKDRVFPRTNSVIGRKVVNCHPPKSMHIVQQILDDFRNNIRSHAEFWIDLHGKYVYIQYFALKDDSGDYMGCLEATQDITHIRSLEGEKRLMD
ncbi:DUF438 domain-containing protein [Vagococcus vulneris]|uniref:Histidine kinase n=1 Tax=Vagococcus vulneris TaxID=1977869 RepID=A0A430A248_9ENTE|nr:DUF438 domain-containing protein [Vagococcus vulneris]RSU00543.1 histidine kinase [Vagococcus vulneris]